MGSFPWQGEGCLGLKSLGSGPLWRGCGDGYGCPRKVCIPPARDGASPRLRAGEEAGAQLQHMEAGAGRGGTCGFRDGSTLLVFLENLRLSQEQRVISD